MSSVPWKPEYLNNHEKLEKYIAWNMTDGKFPNQSSCEIGGNSWSPVKVVDILGGYIDTVNICFGLEFDVSKAYVILRVNGSLSIHELKKLSVADQIRAFLEAALRSAAVLAAIGCGLGITAITNDIASITLKVSQLTGGLLEKIQPYIDDFQRATAWIEKTFHVDLLKRLHVVGQALSPEYRSLVRSYENYLSDVSDSIFGNAAFLPVYMRFYETMLYDQMRRAGKDNDTARYETLKASYRRAKSFGDRVDTYKSNPLAVWDELYQATFEDMNPYIDPERIYRDAPIIKLGGKIAEVAQELNGAVLNIGKFASMLEVDLMKEKDAPLKTLTDRLSGFYDERVEPTVLALKKASNELERSIRTLEALRLRERLARERAALMATPPGELSGTQRTQQARQFIDLFDSSLQPVIADDTALRSDIDIIASKIFTP